MLIAEITDVLTKTCLDGGSAANDRGLNDILMNPESHSRGLFAKEMTRSIFLAFHDPISLIPTMGRASLPNSS